MAVGSGAFPLGMLNEIVKARQVLTEYHAIEMNGFQKKSFYAYERKPYDLKVNTIKNCIFACDIEPSAVDIAKLRLWLSIVIDDEITEDAGNGDFDAHSKPRQLPNLECNIICGNSLIDEFKGNKLITESVLLNNVSENSQQTVFQQGVDGMISKLIELQDKLFFTKEHNDKEEIKAQIQKIYDDIILEQIGGNPPYIGFHNVPDKEYYKTNYFAANGKYDFYVLFIEKALRLLSTKGIMSFICPSYFYKRNYGQNTRKILLDKTNIRYIADFQIIKFLILRSRIHVFLAHKMEKHRMRK